MPSTSRVRVFVDANVLASPVPRTLLYLAQPLSSYELVYSPGVEQEAERHRKPGHVPVSTLRRRWDWMTVPDAAGDDLVDTDPKDTQVLAAAIAARASFVVTGNVRDFGANDLDTHSITTVHPGLFLAHHITAETYREILEAISETRVREPRAPLSIHEQEIAVHLPALFERYRLLFGAPSPDVTHQPPAVPFRGPLCVRCARRIDGTQAHETGLCEDCQA